MTNINEMEGKYTLQLGYPALKGAKLPGEYSSFSEAMHAAEKQFSVKKFLIGPPTSFVLGQVCIIVLQGGRAVNSFRSEVL